MFLDHLDTWSEADERIRDAYNAPCPGEWKSYQDPVYVMHYSYHDIALAWLFEELGVTHLSLSLGREVARALGMFALVIVAFLVSSSVAISLACYGLLVSVGYGSPPIFGGLTILLGLALFRWRPEGMTSRRRWMLEGGLFLLFGFHLYGYFFVDVNFPAHIANGSIVAFLLSLFGLVLRDKRLFGRGVGAFVVTALFMIPYNQYARTAFEPISGVASGKTEGFVWLGLFHGVGDRPNEFGHITTDYGFYRAFDYDPILNSAMPKQVAHQTIGTLGKDSFLTYLAENPFNYVLDVWKRAVVFVAHQDHQDHGLYTPDSPLFTTLNVGIAAALLLLLTFFTTPALTATISPPVVIPLFQYFAVMAGLDNVHNGSRYYDTGLVFLLTLTPAYLAFMVRRCKALAAYRSPDFSRRGAVALGAMFVVMALSSPILIREAKKELQVYRIWYSVIFIYDHLNEPAPGMPTTAEAISPAYLNERLDAIRALGGSPAGSVDIFGAWIFHMMRAWRYSEAFPFWVGAMEKAGIDKETLRAYSAFAGEERERLYQAALAAAPENPYYPALGLALNSPAWRSAYQKSLLQYPDGPFAHQLFWSLQNSLDSFPPDVARRIVTVGEEAMGAFMARTASVRPQYRQIPEVAFNRSGSATRVEEDGLAVTLGPGASVDLAPFRTYYAPHFALALFAKATEGGASAVLTFADGSTCGAETVIDDKDRLHYRRFVCEDGGRQSAAFLRITADEKGVTLRLRDSYPMISDPPLMKRGFE